MRVRAMLPLLVGLAAIVVSMAPLPAGFVERHYAGWLYPRLQASVTAWSNASAFALFDVLIVLAALLLIGVWIRSFGRARRIRSVAPLVRASIVTGTAVAVVYLWFALAWGLNYRRPPLETAIGYDAARVTPAALHALADRATVEVNRLHAPAHRAGFPEADDVPPLLVQALHEVEERLGRPRPTVPGRPKRTLLAPFFQASGVDGMHAPFLLETLLNPQLTPPERPVVLAHEWAHLSGYGPEDEASFVGLMAALRAGPASQYSAWLAIFEHSVGQLPSREQHAYVARLTEGPQADRRAIRQRLTTRVEPVARASWQAYGQYLRAQGVSEGLQSYSRVVQLLLGSDALQWP